MHVSWQWLREYVSLNASIDEVIERLTMAGLNVASKRPHGDDVAIDVEVTSNRPDCLGHLGIAREAAVLFGQSIQVPQPKPKVSAVKTSSVTSVTIDCPELSPQYIARVIRGAKIGASPSWLRKRLETIGVTSINNIVDITNYVLMECGQPLHAFDFDKLRGGRIVVRNARPGEKIVAINQCTYELSAEMCVIADAERPVAVAGVMGGLETEIGPATANLLIETANFAPMSIRKTARALGLHSDSSYRFERGVDAAGLDWASRRCCELILDLAGGELLDEPIVAGAPVERSRPSVRLRFERIPKILGIDVPRDEAVQALEALGLRREALSAANATFVPPSWRRDLTREIDLIEEVARIHGYDAIPHVPVPLQLSARTLRDRISEEVRGVLTAAGCFEAVTLSFVTEPVYRLFQPWGPAVEMHVAHSSRKQENILRQSLVPSLLLSRQVNERYGSFDTQLFEIADVYLGSHDKSGSPRELTMIALVTGRPFIDAKGLVEALAQRVCKSAEVSVQPSSVPQFAAGRGADVLLDGVAWGWIGELDRAVTESIGLKDAMTAVELDLAVLESKADLVPKYSPLAEFPAIDRDLNFVMDEHVPWAALESVVRSAAGPLLQSVGFGGQYRGKQIDPDKKSYVVTLSYRAPDRTLTAEEVDARQTAVIEACTTELKARVR